MLKIEKVDGTVDIRHEGVGTELLAELAALTQTVLWDMAHHHDAIYEMFAKKLHKAVMDKNLLDLIKNAE